MVTTLEPHDTALALVLDQLAGPDLFDPRAWAAALRRTGQAARCEVHQPGTGPGTVAIALEMERPHDGGAPPRARFADFVAAGRVPFEAREPNGAFEVLGVALPESGGAVFWSWAPGRGPREARAFAALARVLDVALALARTRQASDRLAERLAKAEAAHRDEVTALREALEQSQSALELRYEYGGVVHRSPGMRRVLETLDKVTDRDLPVLVLGESGVGKELVARALHVNGPRKAGRFVAENCGAIPKDLFESTFFGHVKGAFTGAMAPRQGLFEQAHGGTLFLDEVGELPLEHQVKLLRVLQERVVRPVGSSREVPVDFRLVAATNRDLEQLVKEGRFREDLFYRLAVVRVSVPPLRERKDDILPICEHLMEVHGARLGKRPRLSPEAADRLQAHTWPGNVRELENEILRALALCDGDVVKARHFSLAVQRAGGGGPPKSEPRNGGGGGNGAGSASGGAIEPLDVTLGRVEKEALKRALEATGGQKAAAARLLGLSRPGLDAKLARHAIDARSLKRDPR
ncbi:MAG: sigma-54 dependent transcriptional regulator [Myxococcota bacterium]